MMKKYPEYEKLDLAGLTDEVLAFWKEERIFERSVSERPADKPYVFYEGPPSANGMPGIHHVMARTIKDIFCRYKTLQGYQVKRKAGWDTHGLPVELGVEKELGITKEDIGKSISVEEYNKACREAVMRYTDVWNDLTEKMGYWVDMDDPYITYENKYIESVWWLLKQIYNKEMLYKGYTIQPYSPKAGTGLSSHELNMPGTYRDVKDTSVVAQFKAVRDEHASMLEGIEGDVHLLAWTTTPWTLPSNTALTVGPKIDYVLVKSFNQYTGEPIQVILAKPLLGYQFSGKFVEAENEGDLQFSLGEKKIPFLVTKEWKGSELVGLRYEQLLPYAQPMDNPSEAFRVIPGDFVTTEDGTGIVHTAPTFGADDAKVATDAGVPPMLVEDENGNPVPLVDLQGRFRPEMGAFAGKYVKNEYYAEGEAPEKSIDVELAILLKEENKAFKVEKYEHSYPHCWRTDKPVLYYPLDSWFIKTTAVKDRLIELNQTINWKPASTGTGRFGNWLENLNDWNLSRSRYWGIPIPIWRTEDGSEALCIGSMEELKAECDKAVTAGVMASNPLADFEPGNMYEDNYNVFDLHKSHVDQITLVSSTGAPMTREADLIDVWFDSGSMPYAQLHYPFENKELIDNREFYPADFIAEGVDQTRGWFFTLHAIGTMVFDSVAYKNVVSNGLVLDKNGQKMSKRLGNAVDPFKTLGTYGADATRWYMISNAQPWDNLRFDLDGIAEVQRKFFGTLYNTYGFFALYANIDGFDDSETEVPVAERAEIDRWIISELNTLIKTVQEAYDDYEPTRAARSISYFVTENLSNWHVRLSRRRFWKGEFGPDKHAAYQTLYRCLKTVAKLMAPIAPFFAERLFRDLNGVTGKEAHDSVHLSQFPIYHEGQVDHDLEERMRNAQTITSLILSLRKKEKIRVRQPLQKVMVPVLDDHSAKQLRAVQDLILSEVNVKEMELISEESGILVKKIKPNFKILGPRYGRLMKQIAGALSQFDQDQIREIERADVYQLEIDGETVTLNKDDVEITSEDIPGWLVASENGLTVALDVTLTDALKEEGTARELVNRIQNIRKDSGLEVTDRITLEMKSHPALEAAVQNNRSYICSETLAEDLALVTELSEAGTSVEFEDVATEILIQKV
ncbi:isoleucine--tRNA ligase [Cryomorphaceae bacterium]|nr:isoleucine--tRNA ligase [Cryomorphaceae bacterium]